MDYVITKYDEPESNDFRFILGTSGNKPLFGIGLNPSTADKAKPDMTIKKIIKFAEEDKRFDSFIMFNIYAQRATSPKQVHNKLDNALHRRNIEIICKTLNQYEDPKLLACWGGTIKVKPFFFDCLADIYLKTKRSNIKWLKIGDRLTASNHPRHPSRAAYKLGIFDFDIEKYLRINYKLNPITTQLN